MPILLGFTVIMFVWKGLITAYVSKGGSKFTLFSLIYAKYNMDSSNSRIALMSQGPPSSLTGNWARDSK